MQLNIPPDQIDKQEFIKFQVKLNSDSDWEDINLKPVTDTMIAAKYLSVLKQQNPHEMQFRAMKVVNKIETTFIVLPYLLQEPEEQPKLT